MKKLLYSLITVLSISALSNAQTSSITTTESRCRESGTAKIAMTPSGSYSYQLTSGPVGYILPPVTTSDSFSALKAGNYTVQVTNSSGFSASYNFTVAGNYQEPSPLTATVQQIKCPSGSGSITAIQPTNGRLPYTYQIASGPVTFPSQSSPVFSGLPAGTYNIQSFDSCGVVRSNTYTVGYDTGYITFGTGINIQFPNCNDLRMSLPQMGWLPSGVGNRPVRVWWVVPNGDTIKSNMTYETLPVPADTLAGYFSTYGTYRALVYDTCGRVYTATTTHSAPYYGAPTITRYCNTYSASYQNTRGYGIQYNLKVTKCTDTNVVVMDTTVNPLTGYDLVPINGLSYDTCYRVVYSNECGHYNVRNLLQTKPALALTLSQGTGCAEVGTGAIYSNIWPTGTYPVTYKIISGPAAVGTSFTSNGSGWFSNMPLGTYEVEATDSCGAKDTTSITLNQPLVVNKTVSVTPNCSGGTDVHVEITSNFTNPNTGFFGVQSSINITTSAVNVTSSQVNGNRLWKGDFVNIAHTSNKWIFQWGYNGSTNPAYNHYTNCSRRDTIDLTPYQLPVIDTAYGVLCSDGTVLLNIEKSGGKPGYEYRIKPQTSTTWSAWQTSTLFTGVTTGTGAYDVNMRDTCPNGSIKSFEVLPFIPASIGNDVCYDYGDTIVIAANQTFNGIKYEWYKDGVRVDSGTSLTINSFAASDVGTYKFVQSFPNGACADTTTFNLNKCIYVSGTVYNDNNAGTPDGATPPTGLYANISNASGTVVATVPVNTDGTYSLAVPLPGDYSVQISTTQGVVGDPTPAQTLPDNFSNVSSTDATPTDGSTTVTLTTTDITGVDFGINEPPIADTAVTDPMVNPGGTNNLTIPATSFTGTDPNSGTPATMTITTFPSNVTSITIGGTTYTSTTFPATGVTIPVNAAGNPTETVAIDPVDGNDTVVITFTLTDSAGLTSNPATVSVPFDQLLISGTVYNDNNAGTPDGTTPPTGLYANISNASGTVVATVPVNADGTYSATVDMAGDYAVQISTTQGVVGDPTPAQTLPDNFSNVSSTDATPTDGSTTVTLTTTDITGVDFGINEPPIADTTVTDPMVNPGGTNNLTIPATSFTGTDPNSGTPATMTITTFPSNVTSITIGGTTYTSATFPATGVTIPVNAAGNPTETVAIDPIDGNDTVVITFTLTDSAGLTSNPATVSVPFANLLVTGNIYNDANGMTDNTVNGTGINEIATQPLYVSLVSSNSVMQTVAVNADGSYTFSNVPAGNYSVILHSTETGSTTASLPNNWVNTGEVIGTGTGDDGNTNGTNLVTVTTSSVEQVNFGVQAMPEAIDTNIIFPGAPVVGVANELSMVPFVGTDHEDQPSAGSWTTYVTITSLPTNGFVLMYDGTPVVAGTQIPLVDMTLLTIQPSATTPIGTNTTSFTYSIQDNAGFSDTTDATYTVNYSAPLPIDLLSFEARKDGSQVYLNWNYADEKDLKYTQVQHSTDGYNFTTIGTQMAQGELMYSFIHNSPAVGKNYYRLNSVANDGTSTLSAVKMVDVQNQTTITVYPNPVRDNLTIQLGTENTYKIKVINVEGKVVYDHTYSNTTLVQLQTSSWATGVYYVHISYDKTDVVEKIIKH